jgi:multiple sugar transport system substrate-binding protein
MTRMIEPAGRSDAVTHGEPNRAGMIDRPVTRRTVLRSLAGVAGLATLPSLAAACGTTATSSQAPSVPARSAAASTSPSAPTPSASPAAGLTIATIFPETDEVKTRFAAETGIEVKLRTVDAGTLSDEIQGYLAATPEDVISWGAGRSKRAAIDGLLTPIDDVWATVGSNFPESVKAFATAADAHRYMMPVQAYAWAIFYRKSLFAARGYSVPATWTEFTALAARMKSDGLIPIALGDGDLFEASGMFDMLDLRLNGCQFHIDLLAGKEKWTDPRVKAVFEHWLEIIPFTQAGSAGRDQGAAAQTLIDKKAGMYLMGTGIMVSSIPASDLDDVDIFPFPALGTAWDAEQAFDMPVDGFAITKNSPRLAADLDNAKAFIEFVSKGSTQLVFASSESGNVALALDADTSQYNHIQKKVVEMIGSAKRVAEYFDRDTDYGFANKVETALQDFLAHPPTDLTGFTQTLQGFWDHH